MARLTQKTAENLLSNNRNRFKEPNQYLGVCFFCLVIQACSLCEDTLVGTYKAPDGKYQATVFYRDCGATTGSSTIVVLEKSDSWFHNSRKNWIYVLDGECRLNVKWFSSQKLHVELLTPSENPHNPFKKITLKDGIKIEYSP